MTPMVRTSMTFLWMFLLHRDLPDLDTQRFATEFTTKTLGTMKPIIAKAVPSMLRELSSEELLAVNHAQTERYNKPKCFSGQAPNQFNNNSHDKYRKQRSNPDRVCPYCRELGRPSYQHYLTECRHLPESDQRHFQSQADTTAGGNRRRRSPVRRGSRG